MDDRSTIAFLYRRAGFGATPAELDAAVSRGFAASVDTLLDTSAPDPAADAVPLPTLTQTLTYTKDPTALAALAVQLRQESSQLMLWWLQRMVAATNPLPEKIALLLHGQFATSVVKVRYPSLMYRQNQIFRTMGTGPFDVMTQALAKDPAMLIWLDAGMDKKAHPNENFARELMERFTIGIGNYGENDVREAARAFTGWQLDRNTGEFAFVAAQHDDGTKTVLGNTGDLGGEDVLNIVTHDPASHRFVVANVWSHLAYPVKTTDPVVNDLVPGYASDLNLGGLVRGVLTHPQFTSASATTGLVKQPIEYVVGTLRALGEPATSPLLLAVLNELGQLPFAPPSVGGWPQNSYWLSTAASLARWQFATQLSARADLSAVADEPPAQRIDAAAHLLSLGGWSSNTARVLNGTTGSPAQLVALALVSPEYVGN